MHGGGRAGGHTRGADEDDGRLRSRRPRRSRSDHRLLDRRPQHVAGPGAGVRRPGRQLYRSTRHGRAGRTCDLGSADLGGDTAALGGAACRRRERTARVLGDRARSRSRSVSAVFVDGIDSQRAAGGDRFGERGARCLAGLGADRGGNCRLRRRAAGKRASPGQWSFGRCFCSPAVRPDSVACSLAFSSADSDRCARIRHTTRAMTSTTTTTAATPRPTAFSTAL